MTTLADLTPEERAQCQGMWCVYETPAGEERAIYEKTQSGAPVSMLFEPGYGRFEAENENITPRADLPRAWAPNGQPPAGKWDDDYTDSDGITLTTGEDLDLGPHQEVRRWIGEWEEA